MSSYTFKARIDIIGINPFVFVPERILKSLFKEAGRDKGPIPVCGEINGTAFKQTLVRYAGQWRLYINTRMLPRSPERIGEMARITIQYDRDDRTIQPHPKLLAALKKNAAAKKVFDNLAPSLQKEIIRYIANLKSEESVERNVQKAVDFLLGKGRFVGRTLDHQ